MILEAGTYNFEASLGTVTLFAYQPDEEFVKSIFNKTAGTFIYNPSITGKNAAFSDVVSDKLITLDYDTSAMNNTDVLEILVCDPNEVQEVSGSLALTTVVSIPISATNFNLNAAGGAAYNVTSNITVDYELDSIRFLFSSALAKTITISDAADNTPIWTKTTTATKVVLEEIDQKFPANHNFKIQVSTTAGACLMTVEATVFSGGVTPPTGSSVMVTNFPTTTPPIETGTNHIGKVEIYDHGMDKSAIVAPISALKVVEPVRLVGHSFVGATVDPNFWDTTLAAAGTATQANGALNLSTGVTANGGATVRSKIPARYTASFSNFYRSVLRLGDSGTVNNTRRWGAFDANDGCFFQLSGTSFSIVLRRATVDTVINSGSFNGDMASYVMDNTAHTFEIHWTNKTVYFFIDDVLIHTFRASTNTWTSTPTLKVAASNENSGGSTTQVQMFVRVMSISGMGSDNSEPVYYNLAAGVNETRVLKQGPGKLIRIVCNTASTGTLTLYDNTAGSGQQIALITGSGIVSGTVMEYHVNFNTGLTYVSASNVGNWTFIYE